LAAEVEQPGRRPRFCSEAAGRARPSSAELGQTPLNSDAMIYIRPWRALEAHCRPGAL